MGVEIGMRHHFATINSCTLAALAFSFIPLMGPPTVSVVPPQPLVCLHLYVCLCSCMSLGLSLPWPLTHDLDFPNRRLPWPYPTLPTFPPFAGVAPLRPLQVRRAEEALHEPREPAGGPGEAGCHGKGTGQEGAATPWTRSCAPHYQPLVAAHLLHSDVVCTCCYEAVLHFICHFYEHHTATTELTVHGS